MRSEPCLSQGRLPDRDGQSCDGLCRRRPRSAPARHVRRPVHAEPMPSPLPERYAPRMPPAPPVWQSPDDPARRCSTNQWSAPHPVPATGRIAPRQSPALSGHSVSGNRPAPRRKAHRRATDIPARFWRDANPTTRRSSAVHPARHQTTTPAPVRGSGPARSGTAPRNHVGASSCTAGAASARPAGGAIPNGGSIPSGSPRRHGSSAQTAPHRVHTASSTLAGDSVGGARTGSGHAPAPRY